MNLKIKLPGFAKGFITAAFAVSFIWFVLLSTVNLQRSKEKREVLNWPGTEMQRRITFQEISPDNQKKAVRYELSYQPQLFSDSHTTYLDNKVIISVISNLGDVEREHYLFVGEERTGNPYWLSSNYVFFTAHCGSSCRGLTLLDARSGQRQSATLSFVFNKDGGWKTHFRDWFDRDFEFEGFVREASGEMINNKPYLIFDMENEKGVEAGQVRLLFTGKSLIPER